MKLLCFFLFLIPLAATAQETEVRLLQLLLKDIKNNFTESIGDSDLTRATDSSYTPYKSKINLPGTADNLIDIARDKNYFSIYTAFISDSCTLKEAKRLTQYWRKIARAAAPNYNETKKDGKHKTFSGHPWFGYDYELLENDYRYWIDISYAERPLNNGYSVMLSLGRQYIK